MDIIDIIDINDIGPEEGWTTNDLIQKRKRKLPSEQEKCPQSYWYGSGLAIRTVPPQKRSKSNPGIPLALFDFIPDNFNQDVNEYKVYNESDESDHDSEEEKEEKVVSFKKKSNENVNEEEVDNKSDDDWDGLILEIQNDQKPKIFDEIEEEKEEKEVSLQERSNEKPKDDDKKFEGSTSTGRRNGVGVPTKRQHIPYLLSDLCKPKNPKTSKGMEKPFKGIAYCFRK